MNARVADVMTKDVMAVRTSASFKQIAAMLRERRVSALPVLDEAGKVIGVVSEADLLPKEALETGHEGHAGPLSSALHHVELDRANGRTAADLMSRPPVCASPYDLVSHAAHVMYDREVSCLPVVDNDRLVGMITRGDVLTVFSRADEDLQRQIIEKVIVTAFHADPAA